MEQLPQDINLGNGIGLLKPNRAKPAHFMIGVLLVAAGAAALWFPLHAAYLAGWNLPVHAANLADPDHFDRQGTWTWLGVCFFCLIGVGLTVGGVILAVDYRSRVMPDSVVIDDEGITHHDNSRGVVARVEWHQVQEVAVVPWECAFPDDPQAIITADTGELSIGSGSHGLPALLVRLAALPGFPSYEFRQALNREDFDQKKVGLTNPDAWRVVVWRRKAAEPAAAKKP